MWISNKIYYLIAALRKLRQENHGLENTLNYVEIPFQKKVEATLWYSERLKLRDQEYNFMWDSCDWFLQLPVTLNTIKLQTSMSFSCFPYKQNKK